MCKERKGQGKGKGEKVIVADLSLLGSQVLLAKKSEIHGFNGVFYYVK